MEQNSNPYTPPTAALDGPKDAATNARPTSITVICVIGFLGAIATVMMLFSGVTRSIGAWYPPYLAFSSLVGLACFIGMWRMKKWAAYTYAGFAGLNQIVLLVMGLWNLAALIIPGIVIAIALKSVRKMT
ncbi:MAG: hypothetical protein K0R43_4091 [Pseudoduganella sp.]|nr:hypothetical protein [Pseudoduganella sp.]